MKKIILDEFKKTFIVSPLDTAKEQGSGGLLVLSTPTLIKYIENCCYTFIEETLEEGYTTVGININMNHLAPSSVGAKVNIMAKVINVDNKIITFSVSVFDGSILIGNAEHKRAVVNINSFMNKINK